ncbi:hypothetical protein TKK_0002663 [Trichogramma kaykai]|uniref:Uncharacterized protein n=1 Tax=Trichogramma kaykai TaxID=54128 RepID=A0ABD2XRW1_9HYME
MKNIAIFVTFFLICGAQAQATDLDEVQNRNMLQTQLQNLIDYLEKKFESSLDEKLEKLMKVYRPFTTLRYNMEKQNEKNKIEIISLLNTFSNDTIYESARKLNISTVEFDEKIPSTTHVSQIYDAVNKCIYSEGVSMSHEEYAIFELITNAQTLISTIVEQAKKCVEEATLSTSLLTATCLTKAKINADLVYATAPGSVTMQFFKMQVEKGVKRLEACDQSKSYDEIRSSLDKIKNEIYNKIIEKQQ